MVIAAAQIEATVGDLDYNLNNHIKIIDLAIENSVDLIVFPEMSLTGYCRKEASELSFTKNDSRLHLLKETANRNNIIIIVGAPIRIQKDLYIGSFIIKPNSEIDIYTKQFLHSGEEVFFKSSFDYNPIIKIKNENIQLAICADIDTEIHARNAYKNNCTTYIASIFFSENGINSGHQTLLEYAKKYHFQVLMSNFTGNHWNIISGGKSAFWNNDGKKISELNTSSAGLLIAEKQTKNWTVKNIQL